MCAKIVTVLNRKGGVGKTTLTIAIADTLISEHNADVTIVDLDPQATASQVLLNKAAFKAHTENHDNLPGLLAVLLKREKDLDKHLFRIDGLSKILGQPANRLRLYPNSDAFWDLEADEIAKDNGKRLMEVVKSFLEQEKHDRHYILIDCPPGQSITVQAVLEASHLVICPMNADSFSVWGKDLLKRYLNRVAPKTRYKFVINRYQSALSVHKSILTDLRSDIHKADMLNVTERSLFEDRTDLARLDVNAAVMNRLNLPRPKPLYRIYGNRGEHQLKKIVDGIVTELIRDD